MTHPYLPLALALLGQVVLEMQTNLFFVETELGEEVVLLDDAVHALQQRE